MEQTVIRYHRVTAPSLSVVLSAMALFHVVNGHPKKLGVSDTQKVKGEYHTY